MEIVCRELVPGITRERIGRLTEILPEANRSSARLFSAPGRVEIGGNHTDHQHGRVLAAAVEYCMLSAAAPNGSDIIHIDSVGFSSFDISVEDLSPVKEQEGTSESFVRGVADYLKTKGYKVAGFTAALDSDVPAGGSMSSSACFGVLVGAIINGLFNDGAISAEELAKAAKYAENVHFGKPCGLMDQMASAFGGFVFIDFKDESSPVVEKIDFGFSECGYTLCILNSKGSHAALTDQYASIPAEMLSVAEAMGRKYLREVDPDDFYSRLGELRNRVSDRALMRAMHFFSDDARAEEEKDALKASDIDHFLQLINASGESSQQVLENVSPEDPSNRSLAFSIAYAKHLLGGRGACRVQGGGFAGTAEAFVPDDEVEEFTEKFTEVFGENSVLISSIRKYGAVEIEK